MKKSINIIFTLIILCAMSVAFAEEKATKEECVAKCKEVAEMIKKIGIEATIKAVQDPKGSFVWKDTYVFLMDSKANVLAHPVIPKLVGQNWSGKADADGKMFVDEYIMVSQKSGEGWVDYVWPKPNEKTTSPKTSFVYKVPNVDVIAIAGIYLN
ncbi:MAG: cache domain-containing protein [Desulfobacterales bacterium]|nr:cache domain-containing protein [Desulfobacterales bacterium]